MERVSQAVAANKGLEPGEGSEPPVLDQAERQAAATLGLASRQGGGSLCPQASH